MSDIPAFGFTPGLAYAERLRVIRMNLNRKFLMRKKKLQQQRESLGIAGGFAHKLPLILLADLCQRLPSQRPIGHLAIVAGKPRFADLFINNRSGDRLTTRRKTSACVPIRDPVLLS